MHLKVTVSVEFFNLERGHWRKNREFKISIRRMMEQLWVALLAVSITTLFSSNGIGGTSGSVLHGIPNGPDYLQWIPPELVYQNVHSPIVLSQLHHGLRSDEQLTIPVGHEQESSPLSSQLHHGLTIDKQLIIPKGNEQESLPALIQPAPVVEENPSELISVPSSADNSAETTTVKAITQQELHEILFGRQLGSSAGDNAIENETESNLPPSEQSIIRVSTDGEEALPAEESDVGIVTIQDGQNLLSGTIPVNNTAATSTATAAIQINADNAALQMETALVAGGENVKVTVGNIPNPKSADNSNAGQSAASATTVRDSKPTILTNVNVNVNVNGDGQGSVINSTSVAEITSPIKTHHKKCD